MASTTRGFTSKTFILGGLDISWAVWLRRPCLPNLDEIRIGSRHREWRIMATTLPIVYAPWHTIRNIKDPGLALLAPTPLYWKSPPILAEWKLKTTLWKQLLKLPRVVIELIEWMPKKRGARIVTYLSEIDYVFFNTCIFVIRHVFRIDTYHSILTSRSFWILLITCHCADV